MLPSNTRMEENVISVVVGAKKAVLRISQTADFLGFSHTAVSRVAQNGA